MKKRWCLGTLNSCEKRKQTVSTQNSLPPSKEKRTLDNKRMQIPSYENVWQLHRSVFFPEWNLSVLELRRCLSKWTAFLWNLMRTAHRINSTSPEGGPIRICFEDVMLACCKEIVCFAGQGKLQQGGSKQGERRNLYPFVFIASVQFICFPMCIIQRHFHPLQNDWICVLSDLTQQILRNKLDVGFLVSCLLVFYLFLFDVKRFPCLNK